MLLKRVKNYRVCSLDLSLRSTGYAYRDQSTGKIVSGLITSGDLRDAWRLYYIRSEVTKLFGKVSPSLVACEGYAMGALGRTFDIGELGGVIKTAVWENGIDCFIIPPTVMKSFIAANGHAKKKEIMKALRQRFNIVSTQDDEADAIGLLLVGEAHCGSTLLTKAKGAIALNKCTLVRGRRQRS